MSEAAGKLGAPSGGIVGPGVPYVQRCQEAHIDSRGGLYHLCARQQSTGAVASLPPHQCWLLLCVFSSRYSGAWELVPSWLAFR